MVHRVSSLPDAGTPSSERLTYRRNIGEAPRRAGEGGAIFRPALEKAIGYDKDKPFDREKLVKAGCNYDLNALFLESIAGVLRIPRALSGFVEARDVHEVASGGVKNDNVRVSKGEEGEARTAKEGYGNVHYHRVEFTAAEIDAFLSERPFLRCRGISSASAAIASASLGSVTPSGRVTSMQRTWKSQAVRSRRPRSRNAWTFTAGRYHATGWDHHVNEGVAEWPPAPWRILRALVSASYRLDEPDRSATAELVEHLTDLPVYRLPPSSSAHVPHYMPTDDSSVKVLDTSRRSARGPRRLRTCWSGGRASTSPRVGSTVELTWILLIVQRSLATAGNRSLASPPVATVKSPPI